MLIVILITPTLTHHLFLLFPLAMAVVFCQEQFCAQISILTGFQSIY